MFVFINMYEKILNFFWNNLLVILRVVVVIFVSYFLIIVFEKFLKRALERKVGKKVGLVILKAVHYFLLFFVFTYAIGELGLSHVFASLLAFSALVGGAVALAVKDSMSNFVSGFFLLCDKDFSVGYRVEVGGKVGIIKDLSLRNTKLEMDDGSVLVVPNGKIEKSGWRLIKRTR